MRCTRPETLPAEVSVGVGGITLSQSDGAGVDSDAPAAIGVPRVVNTCSVSAISTSDQTTEAAAVGEVLGLGESARSAVEPGRVRGWSGRGRLSWRLVAAGMVIALIPTGAVVADVLGAPGTDSVAARLAEWGRDHGFDPVITWAETQLYRPPPTGGQPAGAIGIAPGALATAPAPPRAAPPMAPRPVVTAPPIPRLARLLPSLPAGLGPALPPRGGEPEQPPRPGGLPAPTPLTPLAAGPALAGEGVWNTVAAVGGHPAVRVAALRPDPEHSSFVAGVMWMDPTFVRGQLHPGFTDPGGSWRAPTFITGPLQSQIVAAFNGGFRLAASRGGYYSEGRTVRPLRDGAASLVLDTDGTARVGAWNADLRMSPDVASVRQNLVLLVAGGQVNPTCASGGTAEWGSTIGQAAYIHRSGFGVTATGAEVYVGGPALSVCSLGKLLADAGVVNGMELDINPAWVSGTYFHPKPAGPPQSFRLFPAEQVAPQHYLSPSSRDWYGWYARP